jgi:hypothetical protein
MKPRIWIGITTALLLLGVGKLYVNDSTTVEQALIVEEYFRDYCRLHNSYPKFETLENRFPELYTKREWYYWPNDTWTVATFQYPMTLPLSSAPGRSKVSEFVPIIYSYAVHHPCKGLIQKNTTVH